MDRIDAAVRQKRDIEIGGFFGIAVKPQTGCKRIHVGLHVLGQLPQGRTTEIISDRQRKKICQKREENLRL